MQFSVVLVAFSALVGSTFAELCSCNGSTSKSIQCCISISNYETWNGYECGATGSDISAYQTCCGGESVSFCREE